MDKKFWAFLLILPLLAFCGSKDNPQEDPKEDTDPVITLSSEDEITVGSEAGSGTLTLSSNVDWTVAADDSWLTVTPESGKASKTPVTLTYTYTQNPQTKNRSTYIVVTAYGLIKNLSVVQKGDPMAGAAKEVKNGDVVQATNPLVEKFLSEVNYEDNTFKEYTKVLDYYGGFDGKTLTWDNWETDWPDGDKPESYSIRWKKEDLESGAMKLHLEDELGWSGDMDVEAGALYVNITNLVPNDKYTYKVTAASGKTLAQGSFSTTGLLHQCFFSGNVQKKKGVVLKGEGARNCRDLGGWKTLDGKTVKYRKVYRGGRLNEKWTPYPLNAQGEKEVLFEGIAAELDLRGNSDVIFNPAVEGLDHCAPVIEEGGQVMLGVVKPSAKNCSKWLKYDLGKDIDVDSYTPTDQEFADFQTAYKAKTKECFMFVLNSVRNGKPVHFHCSLGRDRTGTLGVLLLGVLGVREGDIAKEYELTYFAPVGYSVSSSDKGTNTVPLYHNTRKAWVYSDVVPYFWEMAAKTPGGTFAEGIEKYLVEVAGVSQQDVDDFRSLMLE